MFVAPPGERKSGYCAAAHAATSTLRTALKRSRESVLRANVVCPVFLQMHLNQPPPMTDQKYLEIVTKPVAVCASYLPKLGQGKPVNLKQFQELYRQDEFYSWFGLDSPLMYAAHKAAGGMTSVYRQIGIGCQYLLNQILQDQLGLSQSDAIWSYTVKSALGEGAKDRKLTLDGRIPIDKIRDAEKQRKVQNWLKEACKSIGVPEETAIRLKGPVLEVRQGYKSKDSKRQNADVSNATNAYVHNYMPVVLVLSAQIDGDIAERYARARWLILIGRTNGTNLTSAYKFYQEIVGYDLAGFFQRNSATLKKTVEAVLIKLLESEK
jgi:hypothetical protein